MLGIIERVPQLHDRILIPGVSLNCRKVYRPVVIDVQFNRDMTIFSQRFPLAGRR